MQADGHGGETNARIVKLSKDGRFIKAWGKQGSAPGEFGAPHGLAMDSAGRLFVADRPNSRIQIFDQNGTFLAEWRQFGRVKDGNVTAFIPWSETGTLEGVAADDEGNVYGGFTNTLNFRRFVRK